MRQNLKFFNDFRNNRIDYRPRFRLKIQKQRFQEVLTHVTLHREITSPVSHHW